METKCYELILDQNDESLCITGMRKPTVEEATKFITNDLKNVFESSNVMEVRELTKDEAHKFYDMDSMQTMPVFG